MATRKQRLRTLENTIRTNATAVLSTGEALMEIRDDQLYLEDTNKKGEPLYPTWTKYLTHKVGYELGVESAQAQRLIVDAQIRPKLKTAYPVGYAAKWSLKAVHELRRLAPPNEENERLFDFHLIKKSDLKSVVESALAVAKEKGTPVTGPIVKAVVDEYIGEVDDEEDEEEEEGMTLDEWVKQQAREIKGLIEFIEELPGDGWKLFKEDQPRLVKRLATAADSLAALCKQ